MAALSLAVGLGGPVAAETQEHAILPLEAYRAADARTLAEAHAGELRALRADLSHCLPGLAVERHGIAFRRPRGVFVGSPALTLWVWLPERDPPRGPDVGRRAGYALRRYGPAVARRLLGRSSVFADPRVGGYGIILTWLGPARRDGRLVSESIAVFADKLATANFAHETIAADTLLSRAEVRLFDGDTETTSPVGPDDGVPTAPMPC